MVGAGVVMAAAVAEADVAAGVGMAVAAVGVAAGVVVAVAAAAEETVGEGVALLVRRLTLALPTL